MGRETDMHLIRAEGAQPVVSTIMTALDAMYKEHEEIRTGAEKNAAKRLEHFVTDQNKEKNESAAEITKK